MKQILTLVLISACIPLFGQMFFDAGLKGAYGPTFMYNKNILDDGDYDHVLTSGHGIGAKLGVHWANHHGFTFDYMSATSKQDFDLRGGGMHNFIWKHHDLMLLYRYSGNGAYVELGPKFSLMKEVTSDNGSQETDVTPKFVDNYKSLVFGFGSYLLGSDLVTLQAGVRLHWALDDMVSEEGIADNYPATGAVLPEPYTKTHPASAQFMLELNYAFGRFAKASCSHRWRLILFE